MDVILLEKVTNLGNLGEKVTIKSGYGRNYLIPQGKATVATADKLAEFEQRRAELEKKAAEKLVAAQTRGTALEKLAIIIPHKAGDAGKLFGSVGTHAIAEAITNAGQKVEKQEVRLPDGAIRHTGDYEVDIQLHTDVTITLSIAVTEEK
ncbi:MAG: 50S ribosomal protein L9 [Methylococcales bacterium]|nr:50S ribosomal protein L9 [Methylococcales bacterium]